MGLLTGELAEAERIKERLRACKTIEEVNAVANEEREAYNRLKDGGGFGPVMAIQIRNLKAYMIKIQLRRERVCA